MATSAAVRNCLRRAIFSATSDIRSSTVEGLKYNTTIIGPTIDNVEGAVWFRPGTKYRASIAATLPRVGGPTAGTPGRSMKILLLLPLEASSFWRARSFQGSSGESFVQP